MTALIITFILLLVVGAPIFFAVGISASAFVLSSGNNSLAMVNAAISGALDDEECIHDPIFNLDIPVRCPNVPDEILDPRSLWGDPAAYETAARNLARRFRENFEKKYPDMPQHIKDAGPKG